MGGSDRVYFPWHTPAILANGHHSLLRDVAVWAVVTTCLEVIAVLSVVIGSRLRRLDDDGFQWVQRRSFLGQWRWVPLSSAIYNAVWFVFYLTIALLLVHLAGDVLFVR